MKKYIYLFLLPLVLFSSCKKEKAALAEEEESTAFYVKALKDGREWRVDYPSVGYNLSEDKVDVQASTPLFSETILFSFRDYSPGLHKIESDKAVYVRKNSTAGYDDGFRPYDPAYNTYTVTTLDRTTNIATGTFEMHVAIVNSNTSNEKIHFTRGKFRIQLPKEMTF